jgi:hypothetical protein
MGMISLKKGDVIGTYQGQDILSTGDWELDKKLISENIQDLDVGALEQALSNQNTQPSDMGTALVEPESEASGGYQMPDNIKQLFDEAYLISDPKIQGKKLENASKIWSAVKDTLPRPAAENKLGSLSTGEVNDLNTLRDAMDILPKLLELKNSGFKGEGIDTGPIVGSKIPFTNVNLYPSGVSEFFSKNEYGEDASDRADLRQLEKLLFNPTKKDISGTAASDQERFTDLLPMVPSESDNDQAFFTKGLQLGDATIEKIHNILDTAKRSGKDVRQFEDMLNLSPEEFKTKLIEKMSKNEKGSFVRELPDTAKPFLQKKLEGQRAKTPSSNIYVAPDGREFIANSPEEAEQLMQLGAKPKGE